MAKIAYIEKKFRPESLDVIAKTNAIIQEYQAQGLSLTLRQPYYQCVARGYRPNTEKSYDNLGALISDARLAGLVDWNAINDRTRNLRQNSHWGAPGSIISSAAYSYAIDKWSDQP